MRMTTPILILALASCAQDLPDLRGSISPQAQNAAYPNLVPLEPLLARSQQGSEIVDQTARLKARVAALKQRAAALKGRTVVDGATRLKLLQASQRAAERRTG